MAREVRLALIAALSAASAGIALPHTAAAETYGTVDFNEPYNDPDNLTAKSFASMEGISVAEASRRLRIMHEGSILQMKLRKAFPESFAGIAATQSPAFRMTLYFKDGEERQVKAVLPGLGVSNNFFRSIEVKKAPLSRNEVAAQARALMKDMKGNGIDGYVAASPLTGELKLLVSDPASAEALISSKRMAAPQNVKIERFDGIIPTALTVAGGFEYLGNTRNCTRGFNVRSTANPPVYGISTAGHCDNQATDQQWPGVNLAFQQEWLTNGIDSQWSTYMAGNDYLITPKFDDRTNPDDWNLITVTGGTSEYPGLYLCKSGVVTGKTCGFTDQYAYLSGSYGWFSRLNSSAAYPQMTLEGDSGGPVYTGSLAVGMIHGRHMTEGHMYFTSIYDWQLANLPIRVICDCPN